jgi:UDP-glucuronate decarboxylase
MASIASPVIYRRYPLRTIESNVWGLKNLLEYFKNDNLKGFLFFSSSEIYGNPPADSIPTTEDFRGLVSTQGPRACYDEAKRFGETLCYVYNKEYNIPITIVRPFNNYGPGMNINDGRVPADFAKAILTNQNLTIHSDGSPTRTFCYVSDAIVGYFKALMHDNFDTFNIVIDTPEISIKELANIYLEIGKDLLGRDINIQFQTSQDLEYLVDNPNRRSPNITKAKIKLDYHPKIEVKEGVYRYMKFLLQKPGDYR